MKYYAVKTGRKTGIFTNWDECKAQVTGFSGAEYKSFKTQSDAEAYLGKEIKEETPVQTETQPVIQEQEEAYAFVDGSFNPDAKIYGYGGFLCYNNKKYLLMGNGVNDTMADMRNVAGEILGTQAAVAKAEELGLKSLVIYYDYMGIEAWATGAWKTNKAGTRQYAEFMKSRNINIRFEKVKAHTGIEGNEYADVIAKTAASIALTPAQSERFTQAVAMCE